MSDDLGLDPAMRHWLELGPAKAPAAVVHAALAEIGATRQARPFRLPSRFALAAAAAVLVVAAGTGLLPLLGRAAPARNLSAGGALAIGPTWASDGAVVMTVRGAGLDAVDYWRAITYDRIETDGWSQTDTRTVGRPAGSPLLDGTTDEPSADSSASVDRITVTVTAGSGAAAALVVSPGLPLAVDRPVRLTLLGSAGFLGSMALDDPVSGISYRVTGQPGVRGSAADDDEVAELRRAGTQYPGAIADRYLQLQPGTLGSNATALRDRIVATAGSRNPLDLAQAAETVLAAPDFSYSVDVSDQDCGGRSIVECFATYRRGYCMHFATAMAAILRDLGVPTRLVQGYLPGTIARDTATVRDRDAHAWVEVFFPGTGWVTFDPTPGALARSTPLGP
jgi:transglutaminase-like putative cysteine protease